MLTLRVVLGFLKTYWPIAVAAVVGVMMWQAYRKGVAAGKVQGAAAQIELDRRAYEQDRALYDKRMEELSVKLADAESRAQQAAVRAKEAKEAFKQAEVEQEAVHIEIATLPTSELLPDIRKKLGLVPLPGPPCLQDAELRACDLAISERPLLLTQKRHLQAQVASLEEQAFAMIEQVKWLTQKSAEQDKMMQRLEENYIKCYNAYPRKGNLLLRVLTFGILGRPKKLDLPKPTNSSSARHDSALLGSSCLEASK